MYIGTKVFANAFAIAQTHIAYACDSKIGRQSD